jgi:hypothetical protein
MIRPGARWDARFGLRDDALSAAIDSIDLPALIAEHCPESGCRPGTPGTFRAVWRGDRNPSLSLSRHQAGRWLWHDHTTGEGGNAFDFLTKVMGWERKEAAAHLKERAGASEPNAPASGAKRDRILAEYDYTDADGKPLFQVVRIEPKEFRQRHRCPEGKGGWTWNLGGKTCNCPRITPVLYRLPEVMATVRQGKGVYLVEGEKDVHALETLGKVATCNPMGAGKWLEHYREALARAHVVILPDNDGAGREHARVVARSLEDKAASLRIVNLPDLPPKGDVSDWIDAGRNLQELDAVVRGTEAWKSGGEPLADYLSGTLGGHGVEPWGEPRPLPPREPEAPTLPPELLPESLRPWLLDIAERAAVPLEMPAVAALVAIGAAIGRGVGIHPREHDDWLVVPNLWGGIVARPGLMKSAVISEATKPLRRLEKEASREFEQNQAAVEACTERIKCELDELRRRLRDALKSGKGNPDQLQAEMTQKQAELQQAEVTARRFITQDATVEKLGELLRENPRGLLVLRDELAGGLRTLERPGREGDREFYLESWNGTGGYTFDRIGRGTVRVPAVCLSILGGIQPGKLSRYIRESLDGGSGADGLLQRLQLIVWPERVGEWRNVDRAPDAEAAGRVCQIFEALSRLQPADLGLVEPPREEDGVAGLRFSPEAQRLFNDWRDDLEARLRNDELAEAPAFETHLSKYRSLMPSVALIFHLVDLVDGRTGEARVSFEAVRLAAAWCDYLEQHARRLYAAETNRAVIAAHALLERIQEGKIRHDTTLRDIYRREIPGLDTADKARAALDVLAQHGYVRLSQQAPGGRPTLLIHVHPELRAEP